VMEKINKRHSDYVEATKKAKLLFPTLGTKRGLRELVMKSLTRESLVTLWDPLAEFILRKKNQMNLRGEALAAHDNLKERLRVCKDPKEGLLLLEEMEAMNLHVAPLAFADRGPEEQDRLLLASSYSDEWTRTLGPNGELTGYKRSWYICQGNTNYGRCTGLMESKAWRRKNADPNATGQKYNCNLCNGRYRTKYGQLVEVLSPEDQEHYWFRADVPDWDHEDVRAMKHEKHLSPKSAENLFAALESIAPTKGAMVEAATDAKDFYWGAVVPGTYKVIGPVDELSFFKWDEIFNFV